jgi:hypothetical protein
MKIIPGWLCRHSARVDEVYQIIHPAIQRVQTPSNSKKSMIK